MVIEPGRIINDFIEPNKRQYAIPVYQRNYEWSKEQCIKLFEDIVAAYKRDKTHFCGSVVYALLKEEHNINYYVIIDGQQRLTTIYILLKALLDCAKTDNEKDSLIEVIYNKDKFDTYDVDTASKLKLKPIKSDNKQLCLLMDNKYDDIDKSCEIWRNYVIFTDLIKKKQEEELTVKEIYKGIEKLICAKISLGNDDNAQEIFERINSTGVPLSLEDKIRNFVLMTDADQEKLYENYWLISEQLIGRDKMTSFFLDYLNFKNDGFTRIDEAYDVFKKMYSDGKYSNETMLMEIKHYAEFYHAFLVGDTKYSDNINRSLRDINRLKQTTLYYFLFSVFDDYSSEVIDTKEVEKLLNFLLCYSVRRLICEIGSNSLRGLYKTLYNRAFVNPENKNLYYDSVVSLLKQLSSKDAIPSDESFKEALKYNNLYKKNALCKYLLASIVNKGKEQIIIDNLTIEHIMPQNKNLSTEWQIMLGSDWEAIKEKYLNTIGNLTLTAYNSELGDRPFSEKIKILEEVGTKAVELYSDVVDKEKWTAETIENRADRLIEIILKLFAIEEPKTVVEFKDPKYSEYSCDNPDDATNKTPNYYILSGERVAVTSFADMFRSVVDRIYSANKEVIEEMAKKNEKPLEWSSKVLFSYDGSIVGNEYKIKNTDIYITSNHSASYYMYFIRALLDRCEIDRDEFVYSARFTIPPTT